MVKVHILLVVLTMMAMLAILVMLVSVVPFRLSVEAASMPTCRLLRIVRKLDSPLLFIARVVVIPLVLEITFIVAWPVLSELLLVLEEVRLFIMIRLV